jgi:hypothetical protein
MRKALFVLLLSLFPVNLVGQQCSKATASLVSEQSENKFSCGGAFGGSL